MRGCLHDRHSRQPDRAPLLFGATGWIRSGRRRDRGLGRQSVRYHGRRRAPAVYPPETVFKLDHAGNETVLYSFTGGTDGNTPYSGVIRDEAGNLYGTTVGGGAFGSGVVYKVEPWGKETVLYSFCSQPNCADGASPSAGVIRDSAGNLYGTTAGAGAHGKGTVFKLDPASGKETVLYSFTGGPDGAQPVASLIRDDDGNLYGTASTGGDLSKRCTSFMPGCGVVFEIDPAGKQTVLYTFTGEADGANPYSALLKASGNLYGTTYGGGDTTSAPCSGTGCGVVFKLDKATKPCCTPSLEAPMGRIPRSV